MSLIFLFSLVLSVSATSSSHNSSLKFIAVGDWGGMPIFPYKTFVEISVGREMASLSDQVGMDVVLALGDNFYLDGVDSVKDKRFRETFETAFNYKSLNIPWLVVAGNHDYYGNASAQLAYSKKSNRWHFPDYYYKKTFNVPFSNKTLDIVMVDTVILCGNVDRDHTEEQPEILSFKEEKKSNIHWKWLEDTLKTSKANFLLVCGHYPVYSIGTHGPTKCLVNQLEPLMQKYNVSAYFSGHDHSLQHIQVPYVNGKSDYFVSGSANFIDPSKENLDKIPANSLKFHWADTLSLGGFSWFEVTDSEIVVYFVTSGGKMLYNSTIQPRFV